MYLCYLTKLQRIKVSLKAFYGCSFSLIILVSSLYLQKMTQVYNPTVFCPCISRCVAFYDVNGRGLNFARIKTMELTNPSQQCCWSGLFVITTCAPDKSFCSTKDRVSSLRFLSISLLTCLMSVDRLLQYSKICERLPNVFVLSFVQTARVKQLHLKRKLFFLFSTNKYEAF